MPLDKAPAILPLTGLRFFAAFFVCSAHLIPTIWSETSPWYLVGTRLSAEGMSLFFVLSGFVIHYNYAVAMQNNLRTGLYQFFVARFARLVPLYFLCLLFDLMLIYRHSSTHAILHLAQALPYYLTLTQSWFYVLIGQHNLIYQFGAMPQVAWSISTEWFFYMCYPIICFALLKACKVRTKVILLWLMAIVTVAGVAIATLALTTINYYAMQTFGITADFFSHQQDSFFRWLIYFSPYARISEFLLGCLLAAIYMQTAHLSLAQKTSRVGLLLTMFALLAVVFSHYIIWNASAGIAFSWLPNLHRCFGFAPSFALVIFCCARYQNVVTRLLSHPVFLLGGEISYSMYLLHLQIIGDINAHFSSRILHVNAWMKFMLIFAVIFAVSMLSYRGFEVPTRKLLRKGLLKPVGESRVKLHYET